MIHGSKQKPNMEGTQEKSESEEQDRLDLVVLGEHSAMKKAGEVGLHHSLCNNWLLSTGI